MKRPSRKWIEAAALLCASPGRNSPSRATTAAAGRLRRGGRTLGGALSWEAGAARAVRADIARSPASRSRRTSRSRARCWPSPTSISRDKTWARLADGTPLVTAEKRGKGWLVLVHTTANAEWSNLALSGLFVEMLRRIVAMSQGVAGVRRTSALPPLETLDGFGRLRRAAPTARPIAGERHRDRARVAAPSAGLLRHRRCAPRPQPGAAAIDALAADRRAARRASRATASRRAPRATSRPGCWPPRCCWC